MMRVSVTKMHGARNDFVVVDQRVERLGDVFEFARWVCDRRSGVGADGLIVLERSTRAYARMRTINPDGTEAEMCGNGARCASRWLDEAGEGDRISFETEAEVVRTEVVRRVPEYEVRVAMGRPRILGVLPSLVPIATLVDVGNPHVVIFETGEGFEALALGLETLARNLQDHPALPRGANVHLGMRLREHSLQVRHWERGVGLTQACGTGAVACAVAAIDRKMAKSPVEVIVPGGRLVVELDGHGDAYLIGPAVRVFDTEVSV
ncbi:MAG: diaminopimelate epimerase [Candidatus Eremiobacteraeota bacterium]|nr:diaminopimelate epimerase [Candidatus Eremiobacteraeota bacterium]MBV9264298.1 diaminopimelate epimerase [Candidatus Eremiobacteraeota bacterium]